MNILKLRFLFGYGETYEGEYAAVLHSLLTVDGHRLSDEETDMLHLDELVGSIYGYGYFEIYTCSHCCLTVDSIKKVVEKQSVVVCQAA